VKRYQTLFEFKTVRWAQDPRDSPFDMVTPEEFAPATTGMRIVLLMGRAESTSSTLWDLAIDLC